MIMNSRDKRWLALAVVCMGQLMMILDATIVAVALPAIKTDLHFSSSSLTWVMNAYLIAFGSFLLLGGRLGDLIGRTRMFLAGIAIFTGASVLCGVASSEAMLIGARFVQGLGAAAAASAILALIVVEFPDARERVRAMSAYTFVSVAGGSIGLIAGGLLTQGAELALDLLHQRARSARSRSCAGRATLDHDRGLGPRPARRRARVGPDHRRGDDRHLRDRRLRALRAAARPARSASPVAAAVLLGAFSRSSGASRARSCRSRSCGCAA